MAAQLTHLFIAQSSITSIINVINFFFFLNMGVSEILENLVL